MSDPTAAVLRCHVCGEVRPYVKVGIFTIDVSRQAGMSEGMVLQSVIHCRDKTDCVTIAQGMRLAAELESTRKE
jgi:hypothetical protein